MSKIDELEKHLADLSLQREEIHLADLKRQRRDLESHGKQIECPECNITKKTEDETDEDCPECRVIVGANMYLNICKELDSEENCKKVFEKADSGKITVDEFFNIIKDKAKDDPKRLRILEETDELMYPEDVGAKGNPGGEVKKEIVMRKPRPSPSISATSVDVGSVMTGGDGNQWVVKAYKRGDKTIQHWVRYDGVKEPAKRKLKDTSEGHTWLYGDQQEGYSLKKKPEKILGKYEVYAWYENEIVRTDQCENEKEARGYAYQRQKQYDRNLKPCSKEQITIGERYEQKEREKKELKERMATPRGVVEVTKENIRKMQKRSGRGKRYFIRDINKSPEDYDVEGIDANWLSRSQAIEVSDELNKQGYDSVVVNFGLGGNIHGVFKVEKKKPTPKPKKPVKPVVKPKKPVKREPKPTKTRGRPFKSDRQAFTRDGIPAIGHTWLYGDTERGYSIKSGGSKPRYEPEAYIWDNGFVVHRAEYQIEEVARLHAYQDMKRRRWNLEPVSKDQVDVEEEEEEDVDIKVKPETFHKTFYFSDGRPVKIKFFRKTKYDTWKFHQVQAPRGVHIEKHETEQTDKDKAIKYVIDNWGLYEKPPKKTDYKRLRIIIGIVRDIEKAAPDGSASIGAIVKKAEKKGFDRDETMKGLDRLKRNGQIYEPMHGKYRITDY